MLLKLRVTWSISLIHCKVVLWCAWNPNWPAFSRPFSPVGRKFLQARSWQVRSEVEWSEVKWSEKCFCSERDNSKLI
jgi:hypothetical protein